MEKPKAKIERVYVVDGEGFPMEWEDEVVLTEREVDGYFLTILRRRA